MPTSKLDRLSELDARTACIGRIIGSGDAWGWVGTPVQEIYRKVTRQELTRQDITISTGYTLTSSPMERLEDTVIDSIRAREP